MTAGKLAAVATSAAVAIGYASQEQPRFTSSTAAVIVDVVVRDNAGRPVTNLSADDFEILEGGTRQAVKTFQFVDHSRPAATAAPAKALATTSQAAPAASLVEAPTVTALVFEQLGASGRRLAYRAALEYVDHEIAGGNFASVFAVDRALHTLVPYTNSVEALRAGIETAAMRAGHPLERPGRTPGAEYREPGAVSQATKDEVLYARAHLTLDALERLVDSMRLIPGRKAVVLFSEGFALGTSDERSLVVTNSPHRDDNWLTDNRRDHFLQLVQRANDARVAFYTFDAGGLRVESPVVRPGFGEAPYVGLQFLADESGGAFVENTNDLADGVRRVGADLRQYYLLGYTPANPTADGEYREIRVKVKRPGVQVLARKGYRARPADAADRPPDYRDVMPLLLLDSARLPGTFAFGAGAMAFPAPGRPGRTVILARLSIGHLLAHAVDDRTPQGAVAVTILARLKDSSGRPTGYVSQHYDLAGPADQPADLQQRELIFHKEPDLPPGAHALEIIAYDRITSRASVRFVALEVPQAPQPPLMSDVIVVDDAEPVADAGDSTRTHGALAFGGAALLPNLGKPLPPGSVLMFGFAAYPARGAETLAVGAILRDGQPLVRAPLHLNAPTAEGRLEYVGRFRLADLAPGTYQLAVTLSQATDTVTKAATFVIGQGP